MLRAYQNYFEENTKVLTGEVNESAKELISDLAKYIAIPKMEALFKDEFFVNLFKKLSEAKIDPAVLVDIITAKSEEKQPWSIYTDFRINEIFRNFIKLEPNKICTTTLDYIKYIYDKIQTSSKPVHKDFKKLFNKLKYSVENRELLEKTMQDPDICLVLNELNLKGLGPEQVIEALSLHESVRKSDTINLDSSREKDFTTPLTSGVRNKVITFNLDNEIIKNNPPDNIINPQNYNFYENENTNFGQSTKKSVLSANSRRVALNIVPHITK